MKFLANAIGFAQSGRGVALLAGAFLALAGSLSVWLRSPLSEPLSGLQVPFFAAGGALMGPPIAVLVLTGLCLLLAVSLLRWRGTAFTAWALTWLLLFSFPGQLLFLDSTWILEYMRDSVLRSDIQRFTNIYFLKNKGVEPSLVYITDFEHLGDRAALVWQLLGWGWLLAGIGLVLLGISLGLRRMLPLGRAGILLFALAGPALLLLAMGFPALIAEARHDEGDRRLAAGAYQEALNAYIQALAHDPMLGHSALFLTKVSKAYYQAYGDAEPLGQYFLLSEEVSQKAHDNTEMRLAGLRHLQFEPSPFRDSMVRLIAKKTAETYIILGINAFNEGTLVKAGEYFLAALDKDPGLVNARFFLAKTLLDTRSLDTGLKLAESLSDQVYHPSIKADFYSLLGDFHLRMGDLNKAREAYLASYELDNKDNYRAMKEISGT